MYNKIGETKTPEGFLSIYEPCNIYDFIDILVNGSFDVKSIEIKDDADVGLKAYGGEYTFEQFVAIMDNLPILINLSVEFTDKVEINLNGSDNRIYVYAQKEGFDLNHYIEEKKNNPMKL